MYRHEREYMKKQQHQEERSLEKTREIEERERQQKADKQRAIIEYNKQVKLQELERKKKYEQYLDNEEKRKNKEMYDFEQRERDRLAREPYKEKKVLSGADEWKITLKQKEKTRILNEKLLKHENESTELWRQSERERIAGLPEKHRLERLAKEEAIRLKEIEEENNRIQREMEIERIRLEKIEEENRKRQEREAKRKKLEENYGYLMHGTYQGK